MSNSYNGLCIAVTGLNANDNPGPGVAVIRALKAGLGEGIKIIGLCYESLEPGIYMRDLVDVTYQIPYPTAGIVALTERLTYIHGKEKLNLIIPNFDAELYNFIKMVPQLKQMGIHTFLPSLEQLATRDKTNLAELGKKYNLCVPADHQLFTASDMEKAINELNFPLVIKGKFYGAHVTYNMEAALNAFHRLGAAWGYPVIAQQFIKGTEINIAALGDGKGNNISIVPMRKLYITDKGKAWAGVTIDDDGLVKLANDFAKATRWKGGCELEIMKDTDGKLFILEINPRFPAWIYLSVAAGQNQPSALAKMALGEALTPFKTYETGKLFIRHSWDQVVDIADFQKISAFGEL